MQPSSRTRRLHSDLKAMRQLKDESTILDFVAYSEAPETYTITFHGKGVWRSEDTRRVLLRDTHEVLIRLGASYPRQMPALTWNSPIYHPNISGNGSVCLGGYGTHWVPSLSLSELCEMLWEMIRYANYDVDSPYNRDAAHWAKTQHEYRLPLDARPLRDRLAGRLVGHTFEEKPITADIVGSAPAEEVIFLDDGDILPAPQSNQPQEDILFLD